jgi:hypothetical protein
MVSEGGAGIAYELQPGCAFANPAGLLEARTPLVVIVNGAASLKMTVTLTSVDLACLARDVAHDLRQTDHRRDVAFGISDDLRWPCRTKSAAHQPRFAAMLVSEH